MSESDSFITEVSDEVRRDKLYYTLRRYGWIAVLAVIALVGGAAWNEYTKSNALTAARESGDTLLAALNDSDPAASAAALDNVVTEGEAAVVARMLEAAAQAQADDPQGAAQTLAEVSSDPDARPIYRHVAALKAAMLDTGADMQARLDALEPLAQPGEPLWLLAREQIAYVHLEAGETDTAITILREIADDAAVTRNQSERMELMLLALGSPLGIDDAPEATE